MKAKFFIGESVLFIKDQREYEVLDFHSNGAYFFYTIQSIDDDHLILENIREDDLEKI